MNSIMITGACGGIGSAVSERLLRDGFNVIAVDYNETLLNEMFGGRQNCVIYRCDMSSEDAIVGMFQQAVSENGPLRGLVHCAGFNKIIPLYLLKQKDIDALFSVHTFAAMHLCKMLAKRGNTSEACSAILISSLSSHEGSAGNSAYAAAKGALEGFLPAAACELADKGIRLNVLVPGDVATNMFQGFFDRLDDAQRKKREDGYPFGFGKPEDIANVISFLISEDARWITGQKFVLDGGHLCRRV